MATQWSSAFSKMQGGGDETMSSVFTLYNSKDRQKICVCSYFLTHGRLSLNEMHERAQNSQDFLRTFYIFILSYIFYFITVIHLLSLRCHKYLLCCWVNEETSRGLSGRNRTWDCSVAAWINYTSLLVSDFSRNN